jgi:hypothetical protein
VGQLADTDLGEPELCNPDEDGSNRQRNVQELGDLISLLVTKNTNKEQQPQSQGYSSRLLDFIAASVSCTATQLIQVTSRLLMPEKRNANIHQHEFLKGDWQPIHLIALVGLSQVASRRFFGLPSHSSYD